MSSLMAIMAPRMANVRALSLVQVALLAIALAGPASAHEAPRYTWLQAGYVDIEFDDVDGLALDGDGISVAGSVALSETVHVFADRLDGDIDVEGDGLGGLRADYTAVTAGIGFRFPVSDTVDVLARLAWVGAEVEVLDVDEEEDGHAISAGVRAMVTSRLEVNGFITRTDFGGGFGSETSVAAGAVYAVTPRLSAVAGVSLSDDVTEYSVGLRLHFGD